MNRRAVSVPLVSRAASGSIAVEASKIAERIARQAKEDDLGLSQSTLLALAQLEAISAANALILAAMRDDIAALKRERSANLADFYRGSWLPGRYQRGALVTHGGHLWIAVEDGDGKPGESSGWRMMVKGAR